MLGGDGRVDLVELRLVAGLKPDVRNAGDLLDGLNIADANLGRNDIDRQRQIPLDVHGNAGRSDRRFYAGLLLSQRLAVRHGSSVRRDILGAVARRKRGGTIQNDRNTDDLIQIKQIFRIQNDLVVLFDLAELGYVQSTRVDLFQFEFRAADRAAGRLLLRCSYDIRVNGDVVVNGPAGDPERKDHRRSEQDGQEALGGPTHTFSSLKEKLYIKCCHIIYVCRHFAGLKNFLFKLHYTTELWNLARWNLSFFSRLSKNCPDFIIPRQSRRGFFITLPCKRLPIQKSSFCSSISARMYTFSASSSHSLLAASSTPWIGPAKSGAGRSGCSGPKDTAFGKSRA